VLSALLLAEICGQSNGIELASHHGRTTVYTLEY